ncbi:GNAT family N-acetyltransferase [Aestuariibacter halophilus]|uniref:GNAT family N-acetyltransferase n=1 Tax=Fluctibacter halophilus TaxID=226011 RepID=A0ABS8G5M0_9ALTE|nr:GNAT family N-acetyltransferase [Aestuariibacter halophilus]
MQHISAPLSADQARKRVKWLMQCDKNPANAIWVLLDKHQLLQGLITLLDDAEQNRAEMGIMLLPRWHGSGLGAKALYALTRVAFLDLNKTALFAQVSEHNLTVARILRALGFTESRHQKHSLRHFNCTIQQWRDNARHTLFTSRGTP